MDGLSFAVAFLDVAGRVRYTRVVLRAPCEPCGQCSCWLPNTTNVLLGVRIDKAKAVCLQNSKHGTDSQKQEKQKFLFFYEGVVSNQTKNGPQIVLAWVHQSTIFTNTFLKRSLAPWFFEASWRVRIWPRPVVTQVAGISCERAIGRNAS